MDADAKIVIGTRVLLIRDRGNLSDVNAVKVVCRDGEYLGHVGAGYVRGTETFAKTIAYYIDTMSHIIRFDGELSFSDSNHKADGYDFKVNIHFKTNATLLTAIELSTTLRLTVLKSCPENISCK